MDEDDWAFFRESLGPWGRASDGWVDLKRVLGFLGREYDQDQDEAARKLKPAIVRGEVPHRVLVSPGRWEYLSGKPQAHGAGEPPTPSPIRRVWISSPDDLRRQRERTDIVQRLGGWFYVDWQEGEARGHTIQVEWRAVLRTLGLSKVGDPEKPPPEVAPRTKNPGGRPPWEGWPEFDIELVARAWAGEFLTKRAAFKIMWEWTHQKFGSHPDQETVRRRVYRLLPRVPAGSADEG